MMPKYSTSRVSDDLSSIIRGYQGRLNIVEQASVGNVEASQPVCAVLIASLSFMLQYALDRGSAEVRVVCTVSTNEILELEVSSDGLMLDAERRGFGPIGYAAENYGGEITTVATEGRVASTLRIPLIVS